MANNDLISRSALLAEYDWKHIGHAGAARKLMVDAPAADAAPVVHGRWDRDLTKPCETMTNERHVDEIHVCSVCRNMALSGDMDYFLTDYCPFCGAKMDGDAPEPEEDEVCEACAITYSWERGSANVLGETNDADD